jgi:hypothetical protein
MLNSAGKARVAPEIARQQARINCFIGCFRGADIDKGSIGRLWAPRYFLKKTDLGAFGEIESRGSTNLQMVIIR